MKRLIAILLACTIILSSCAQPILDTDIDALEETTEVVADTAVEFQDGKIESDINNSINLEEYEAVIPEFTGMNDETLLRYVEDNIYTELISELNSDEYYIESVKAVYVSKEYLEETSYNSLSNIFFGYTLDELDEQFQDMQYVFTLGGDGTTDVQKFEAYDDTYERIIKNVAIGTGVILVSVTVSGVTGGIGAPAVNVIFTASAKSGTIFALSSGGLSGVISGVVTGMETGDFNEAAKAGALAGSESFKWGAISGTLFGGVSEGLALRGATLNGLTMNEAALIQKDSKYPLDLITQFKSMKEYEVYKKAGLETKMVNGKLALVRKIDLTYKSKMANGRIVTNLERMEKGYPPIDPVWEKSYNLHHINQKADGTLAILTDDEHRKYSKTLHTAGKESEIIRDVFAKQKKAFWRAYASGFGGI
ncbi:HNH/ENDO VII family nuclease [Clostridiaceae bacterium HSG29]|nr:HNH/ENDO VII family nuclease [Clostridiaceae bacterium HSG29]